MAAYRHRQQRPRHTIRYGPRHFYRHQISGTKHLHHRRTVHVSKRKRRIWLAAGLALGVILLAVLALSFSAYRSITSAKNTMESARLIIDQDLSDKQVFLSASGRTALASSIETVTNDSISASAELHSSIGLKVLGQLPYLSDQRNGILNLVGDAGTTATTASTLLAKVNTLVAQSSGTTVSLTALKSLQQSIAQAHTTFEQLNRPVGDLFGPLGTARREFDTDVVKITGDLERGNETLNYALPFLGADGPRTYLIAGENNSEMRDQGSVLSVGEMHAENGTFTVDTTGSVDNIEPTQAVDVPIPAGTQQVFGGYGPTQIWQSVNASADFPFSGEVMQAMFAQAEGTQVNGVIALDVPALESLLNLTGPVTVPNISGSISASNVAEVLLHEQYLQYPVASLQGERHDNISAVAKAVFDQMKTEHIDLAQLANTLASDVAGRHLIVWDESPANESTLRSLGASGAIDTTEANRTFHLAVENSTATKLDYYVDTTQDADVRIAPNGDATINTSVTVTNTTPAGSGPSFQIGPDNINSFTPGQYVSRVVLWAPRDSIAKGSVEESGLELSQSQVSVLPQQSQTVTFTTLIRHAIVNGKLNLRFVPQPRLVPPNLKIEIFAPGWNLKGSPDVTESLAKTTNFTWGLTK